MKFNTFRVSILSALAISVVFVFLAVPLVFHQVGDVRQLVAFSPVSTDEAKLVKMVMRNLQTGQFGAHDYYGYGGFYFALCLGACYAFQWLVPLNDVSVLILCRLISVLFGALSLPILYLLGRRLFDRATALLAVMTMVTSWVFVFWSVNNHSDLPQAFFLLLALYSSTRLIETQTDGKQRPFSWLVVAVACGALAFSIKYAGLFILPVIWLAYLLSQVSVLIGYRAKHSEEHHFSLGLLTRREVMRHALSLVLVSLSFPLVYFITTPYALTDFEFLNKVRFESTVVSAGKFGVPVQGTVWLSKILSVRVLGLGLSALALLYIAVFVWRYIRHAGYLRPKENARLVVLSWVVLYFAFLYWFIDYHPPHYLLPIFPSLCLFAARGGVEVWLWQPKRKWLTWLARAVVILTLAHALYLRGQEVAAFYRARINFSPENHPVIRAGMWLEETFPAGTVVCSDASYNYVPEGFESVPLDRWQQADVILINRTAAGTFDDPRLADGFVGGRDTFWKIFKFYQTFLNEDFRPPNVVEMRDFGAVIAYLNVETFLHDGARAQFHRGSSAVVLPARQLNRDAIYVFSAQDEEAITSFDHVWSPYAQREDLMGRNGERLAVAFRVENAQLPDRAAPVETLLSPTFPLRLMNLQRSVFAQGAELLGYTVDHTRLDPNEPLDVTLYWHNTTPLAEDYTVFAHLLDSRRQVRSIGDKRPLDGLYPTTSWQEGDTIIDRFRLTLPPCASSGPYFLAVGLYRLGDGWRLPLAGENSGTAAVLGPFDLALEGPVAAAQLSPQAALDWQPSGSQARLIGLDLEREEVMAGQVMAMALYWQAVEDTIRVPQVKLHLSSAAGERFELAGGRLDGGKLAGRVWRAGEAVCTTMSITTPVDAPPNEYELVLESEGDIFSLGRLRIQERKGSFEAPASEFVEKIQLGDEVLYWGQDPLPSTVKPGQKLSVSLYWQALKQTSNSYKVFLHLVAPNGAIVAQVDSLPMNGSFPTVDWLAGEFVRDVYELTIPEDCEQGLFHLVGGMYDELTQRRLEVRGFQGNTIPLGTVTIVR